MKLFVLFNFEVLHFHGGLKTLTPPNSETAFSKFEKFYICCFWAKLKLYTKFEQNPFPKG